MPEKGTSIPIKKGLGGILILISIGFFLDPSLITQWKEWNNILAIILIVASYFLLIAGRQLE